MTTVDVYVLSDADCQSACSINANHPRGPQVIICDYGAGSCIEETAINDPLYSEWYDALNAVVPFASRSTVTCNLPDTI